LPLEKHEERRRYALSLQGVASVKFLRFLSTTALQRLVKLVVVLCHVLPSRAGVWSCRAPCAATERIMGEGAGKVKPSARFAIYRILWLIFADYQKILFIEFVKAATPPPSHRPSTKSTMSTTSTPPAPKTFGQGCVPSRKRPSRTSTHRAHVRLPAEGRRLRRFRRFVEGRYRGSHSPNLGLSAKGQNDARSKGRASAANGP